MVTAPGVLLGAALALLGIGAAFFAYLQVRVCVCVFFVGCMHRGVFVGAALALLCIGAAFFAHLQVCLGVCFVQHVWGLVCRRLCGFCTLCA